jgi:MinD-like ATPase involved in chromosome partitioning or flagellar assembly
MKAIAVHSYKGGTGKTNISMNLAVIAANQAKRVALLELDLDSPAIHNSFQNARSRWINEYLDGSAPLQDTLIDVTEQAKTSGLLQIAFADPNMQEVRKSASRDRKGQLDTLKRLMETKDTLKDYDYVFFDTSPGVTYSSVNAVISADRVILVAKPDSFDIDGTDRLIKEFYEGLEKKTGLVINRVLTPEAVENATSRIEIPMLASIPCYCEVAIHASSSAFINTHTQHPFVQNMKDLFERVKTL